MSLLSCKGVVLFAYLNGECLSNTPRLHHNDEVITLYTCMFVINIKICMISCGLVLKCSKVVDSTDISFICMQLKVAIYIHVQSCIYEIQHVIIIILLLICSLH